MPLFPDILSAATVSVPRPALKSMIRLVRLLDRLSQHPVYRNVVAEQVPEVARFDPGHAAVMMGFDFHLTPAGPQLIEVNTNAGGIFPAWLAAHPGAPLSSRLKGCLLNSFAEEIKGQSRNCLHLPKSVAILDENPQQQFLYPEMLAFVELFREAGIEAEITGPEMLRNMGNGLYLGDKQLDLIYNRHCDFYLESPLLEGVRSAYLTGSVCLTPNPFIYALLADKRRLILWRESHVMERCGLNAADHDFLKEMVPDCQLLAGANVEDMWRDRGNWVFKPADRFGSRGVLVGEKMTRGRFDQLIPGTTLIQRHVQPSMTDVPGYGPMKTDLRLYAYRSRVFAMAARLYRGQVTNLRTAGGGFAAVRII